MLRWNGLISALPPPAPSTILYRSTRFCSPLFSDSQNPFARALVNPVYHMNMITAPLIHIIIRILSLLLLVMHVHICLRTQLPIGRRNFSRPIFPPIIILERNHFVVHATSYKFLTTASYWHIRTYVLSHNVKSYLNFNWFGRQSGLRRYVRIYVQLAQTQIPSERISLSHPFPEGRRESVRLI